MADDLVLGIDIGTTTVKACAFDLRGRAAFTHSAPYPTRRAPGGIVEQDPAEWLDEVERILARLVDAGLAGHIVALGVTSQVNTHVFVGHDGKALAPAFVWQDVRCAEVAAAIDGNIPAADRMRWWGAPMPVDASHALSRMAWMAQHRPDIWAATRAVLLPKDYVVLALTGEMVSDPVSNIGLVGRDLRYVDDLVARLPGAAGRLPPLRPAAAVAGRIRLAPGLPDIPVSVGIMDAWAAMYGVGMASDGDAVYLSGTSEVLGIVSDRVAPEPGILVFPPNGGITLHAGPTQSGGASVDWFCAAFGTTPDEMASEAAPVTTAPLFLPHLAGERAPLWDAEARGAFLGLDAGMARGAMARGLFEGVAMQARLLLGSLERSAVRTAGTILCGGGGFRSDLWNQIRADMLDRPLKRLAVPEAGALGAAAIASVAAGLHPDLAAALKGIVAHDRCYEPDPAQRARCDDLFALYQPAYEALQPISHALARRPPDGGTGN